MKYNALAKDGLLKSSFIFLIGAMFVAFFNYLYHVFMGRLLGPTEYGILGSLFAIIYLTSFASNTFTLVLSKYSAEMKGRNQLGTLKHLISASFKKMAFYGFILLSIYIVLSGYIANFMNLTNTSGVILVGIIAYISILDAILIGALNGLQKFVWQNASSFLSTFTKFFLALLLVYLGFGVNGALIAILAGAVFAMLIAFIPLIAVFKNHKRKSFNSKKVLLYTIPVVIATLIPLLMITLDIILVKHYLTSEEAGFYTAAGNIAKVIWFVSGFLAAPLFPKIVELSSKGEKKKSSRLLIEAIFYTSIIIIASLVVYFLFPNLIVNILYGSQYLTIAPLIGWFGLALGLYSITLILTRYNLALEKYGFIYILFIGFIIEMLGIYFFHDNLMQVVYSLLFSNIFILVCMLFNNRKDLFGL